MTGVNGDIRITTLVENVVYGKGLQGEHGLSLLVEVGERKVLFDTGASDLFIRNARLMGIDLREVDYLVLSHGHRDHTGGLHHFLRLNERATVVCKREALRPKFKDERENGLMHPETLDIARFRFVEETEELLPGVFVFPHLPIADEEDTHFDRFYTLADGVRHPDRFDDELALVLKRGRDVAVLSACSHRGITNREERSDSPLPGRPPAATAGCVPLYGHRPICIVSPNLHRPAVLQLHRLGGDFLNYGKRKIS